MNNSARNFQVSGKQEFDVVEDIKNMFLNIPRKPIAARAMATWKTELYKPLDITAIASAPHALPEKKRKISDKVLYTMLNFQAKL